MVVTNSVTFLSYSAICLTLLYLARKTRKVIAGDWVYFAVGFALFIVACGSTHLMEVVTTWAAYFWVAASANIITSVLSAYVAIQLFRRASIIGFSVNDYAKRLANTEAEKQHLQASLLAAQRLEECSRISATMGHEIRNPLEAVQNLLYVMKTSPAINTEIAGLASQCEEEITRVIAIAESTLNFFRQNTHPEKGDLKSTSESLRFLLHPALLRQRTEFVIAATGDCTVEAYGGETRQVLLNLVRNAAEATTRQGTRILLTLQGETEGVRLTIEDEGSGIDPSVLPSLFRFGVSTKGDAGNGMGLWAVKHIVERHGGDITVRSTPGQGTRFDIWWPRPFCAAMPPAMPAATALSYETAMVA